MVDWDTKRVEKNRKKSIVQCFHSDTLPSHWMPNDFVFFFPQISQRSVYLHILCLPSHQIILFIENHLDFSQTSSQTLKDIIGCMRSDSWSCQNHLYLLELTFWTTSEFLNLWDKKTLLIKSHFLEMYPCGFQKTWLYFKIIWRALKRTLMLKPHLIKIKCKSLGITWALVMKQMNKQSLPRCF